MAETLDARPNKVALGVTLVVVAVFLMSIQDSLFKIYSDRLSLWQIFALRGLLTLPLFFLIALGQGGQRAVWAAALSPWPLLRSLFMTTQLIVFYATIPHLSLSTVAAGIYSGPIFVTLLSAVAIGEPVGIRRWIAVALGFAGVLLILQPGGEAFTPLALLPVLGGLLYALTHITARGKCQGLPAAALSLSLNLTMLLAGVVFSAVVALWQPPAALAETYAYLLLGWSAIGPAEWGLLALLALLVVAIQMGLAGAYQVAPPASVAPFDYSYLIFVAAMDYLVFATAPSAATLLGMLLIVGAGLLAIRRR